MVDKKDTDFNQRHYTVNAQSWNRNCLFSLLFTKRHSKKPLWKCNKCKLIMSHQGFNKIFQITKYVTERFYIPKKSYIVNVRKRRCCSYNFVSIHKSCCNNIHTKCQLQGVKLFFFCMLQLTKEKLTLKVLLIKLDYWVI